jgi:hypothetical protein
MSNLKTHGLWLIAHLRAIVHICQKTRKVDFGVDEILRKSGNSHRINKIQMAKNKV